MSVFEEAQRGELAQAVLTNVVYVESYGLIEAEIIRKWQEADNTTDRERLHLMLKMLGKVRDVMQATANSGKVASKQLEIEQTRLQKAASAVRRIAAV